MSLRPLTRSPAVPWLIFSAVWLVLYWPATTGRSFSALYVFGDSLSDTGRNPAPAGNYYEGRYSNGPLWVEYLSAELGIAYNPSNNFAVSGSTSTNLLAQIAGLTPSTNLQTGLFTLESGGNDFIANTVTGLVNNTSWAILLTNIVNNMTNAVGALYTNGARNILVGDLANLAQTPAFMAADTEAYSNLVISKVTLFDEMLYAAMTNEMPKYSGLRLYLTDDYAALSNVLSAPAVYGFTVITQGALEDLNLTNKSFTGPGANYVFWDTLHPTTNLHALTAAAAFDCVAAELQLVRSGTNFSLNVNNLYPTLPYTIESSTNLTTWSTYEATMPITTNLTLTVTNGRGKTGVYYRVSY